MKTTRIQMQRFLLSSFFRSILSGGFLSLLKIVSRVRNRFGKIHGGINKVLIVQLANIGDAILTTPVISALRKEYNATIHVLTMEENREVFEGNSSISKIIYYSSPKYARSNTAGNGFKMIQSILRSGPYDFVIYIRGDIWSLFYLIFGKYRKLALYQLENYPLRMMWAVQLGFMSKPSIKPPHNVEAIFQSLERVGLHMTADICHNEKTKIIMDSADYESAKKELKCNGIVKRFAVLHCRTPFKYRSWPQSNYIKLIQYMTFHLQLECVLVGGDSDWEFNERIVQSCGEGVHNFAGDVNLRQLAALVDMASIFIGSDSGPMHVASVTDTPILAFFGPQMPEVFAPWRTKAVVLYSQRTCSPCWQRRCISPDDYCLMDISVDQAISGINHLLKNYVEKSRHENINA